MTDRNLSGFLHREVLERFCRYVRINTASCEKSTSSPSTPAQLELARLLKAELQELGLTAVTLDEFGYVYATLPASPGITSEPLSLLAHLDTSPAESGENVQPVLHEKYQGGLISFADDPNLILSPEDSPELLFFKGETIITASGTTLLGADNKAGIAEIMAVLSAFVRFRDLMHPELRICFTPDEEVGRGTGHIDVRRLGTSGYTVDGGMIGEIDVECFHALQVEVEFSGINIHPGYAKNRMINAGQVAARFAAALPRFETPENTEGREGFYHLTGIEGNECRAILKYILRDFDDNANRKRVEFLEQLKETFAQRDPGLKIELSVTEQYRNMAEVLNLHPDLIALAEQAMILAGVVPVRKAVRGGTDGARLCFMGLPTPNLFTGGMLFHSRKEWIAIPAMQKACEVLIKLCALYAGKYPEPIKR
ncbi:MAG: peptidase T [Deltaproteobacteria bacterium]|nr:peptidase T [Deltaproteobacteria bacterium]TLN00772.1 MAG: peptidase T [bacterium]